QAAAQNGKGGDSAPPTIVDTPGSHQTTPRRPVDTVRPDQRGAAPFDRPRTDPPEATRHTDPRDGDRRAGGAEMTEGGRYRGRPVSWMAVVIILTGFTLGGLGLVVDRWW